MTTYRIGAHVYVTHDNGAGIWFGTVVYAHPAGDRIVYTVRDGNGDDHSGIEAERMAPSDTPLFPAGATVHVAPDAPFHADRYGTVTGPEFHGDLFGYWLNLTGPSEQVWVPAEALVAVRIGGGSR